MTAPDDRALNRATVAGYDASAAGYAAETDHAPFPEQVEALQALTAAVGPGGRVLEVGSGPGWDADRLEAMGLDVRRTDLSDGFIAVQRARGRAVERLDLIADDLGGPWDGLVVLYVIQHIGRGLIDAVIGRMAAALRPGGALLMSWQEGEGERIADDAEGRYQVVRWREPEMVDQLSRHGLVIDRRWRFQGRDAVWIIVMARRS
ncbi:MAG: class I SAM-dependent methyltransferase [Brevundimonas sp.]